MNCQSVIKYCIFLVLLSTLPSGFVSAQVVLENLPPNLKWNQIKTQNFRIIFPSDFETEALRVANTLEHLYTPVSKSLKIQPKQISVVLQNQNIVTNGFVAMAPRRSEFFTTPPQNYTLTGTMDWLDLLSVHEYRHVAQRDKSKTGFTKLVYWALGGSAFSGMGFAAAPAWFWEGDAVGIETALSKSGRGRMSNFDMAMRASFLENGPYNYHKQYLRSFKDFVPNHYVLGYHLTTYLRTKENKNIWEPITENAFNYSFVPFTFSNSIKKSTGKFLVKTYNKMADTLVSMWTNQLADLPITSFQNVNNRSNEVFTSYKYPVALDDGSIIVQKSGLSDFEKFIRIAPDGTESKVFTPGLLNDPGYISVGGDLLVWTEFQLDPRWRKRTYSVVKTYNLKTRKVTRVTNQTRYTGASVSPDGTAIVVVDNSPSGDFRLMVITANMGNTMKAFDNPGNKFYSMPQWSNDGKDIVVIKHGPQTKEIVRLNFASGQEEVLLQASNENIGNPVLYNNYLFYNSDKSGIDNIYAIDTESGHQWQVTSSRYGAFNPSITSKGDEIYYNDFTANGMDVVKLNFNSESWLPMDAVKGQPTGFYLPLVDQEQNPDVLSTIPNEDYPISNYSRASQLFNIHSWGPYFGTSVTNFEIGVSFQDVLSLNRGFLGYDLDAQDLTGKWKVEYSYQGFFPVIDFEATTGNRVVTELIRDSTDVIREIDFDWEETGIEVGLRIPLEITSSKYFQGLSFSDNIAYNHVTNFTNTYVENIRFFSQQGEGNLISNELEFSFFSLLKTSKRDINSRWGQVMTISGVSTPFGGDYDGGLFAIAGRLYFPGLFKHHSTNFLAGYQHQKITLESNNYWFANRIPFPRGYSSTLFENFYTFRTNYEFTLWNADLALGPILNIQRIRTRLFYDTGFGITDVTNFDVNRQLQFELDYWSTGAELWFDFNFMRLQPLLSGGIRTVYLPDQGLKFEIVIGNIRI